MFMAATTNRRWRALRGEAAIADTAQRTIASSRAVSAFDAAADARGPGNEEPLPIFERVMGPPAPSHAVDQTAPSERLAEGLAA